MQQLTAIIKHAWPPRRSWLGSVCVGFVIIFALVALYAAVPPAVHGQEPDADPVQPTIGTQGVLAPILAVNAVTILEPPDGTKATAAPCPFAPCTANITFEVQVSGAPMDTVELFYTPDDGPGRKSVLCRPPDPIEGIPGCPDPPEILARILPLRPAEWTVEVKVKRGAQVETSAPVHLTVEPPTVAVPGTVALSAVGPLMGSPPILVRAPGLVYTNGLTTIPSTVTISGTNLHNNPFLEVYAAPIPVNEPSFTPASSLPTANWCKFKAEIVDRGQKDGVSFLVVEVPEIPMETPSLCTVPPGPSGSSFVQDWRWLIRDRWIRPVQEHTWWAIPSPRTNDWHDAPPFRMVKPNFPLIDGFGFDNEESDPTYNEFLTVYGNNAYLCVGGLGLCATRLPDPLYHLLWWPIYNLAVGSTGGSCNGISATSLLMAAGELDPKDFDPAVNYAYGFDKRGEPATYKDTNFCTPVCSPPKPKNLWANIRMNHGVQISREFLLEILETLGEAIFNPNDLASVKGVPNATLARVAANPQGYVVCFFKFGGGHCVTPYRVTGNRIWIYDNNKPGDDTLYIDIVGGDYDYPARTKEPNSGNAIMAFPIDIWKNGRHLLGLDDLSLDIDGDIVEFLSVITVGSGDMVVTNDAGGRWGWEDDGTFTDAMMGAVTVPPLDQAGADGRMMPLLVAMNQPAPEVEINATGGRYLYQTGAGGHLFQIEAQARAGDKDQIQLGYAGGDLDAFDFTPQRNTSAFVPRVGLVVDDEESALFHWLGLEVPGGEGVGFNADKLARAASYRNNTGAPTSHLLALDHGSGLADSFGRMIYGPFNVPEGASQRVILNAWPDVTEVVVELDLDGNGIPEQTETVTGQPATQPLNQAATADLSLSKTYDPESVGLEQSVPYTLTVVNAGPDDATGVVLVDLIPSGVTFSSATTTKGTCDDSSGLNCELGDLPSGETAVVTYVVAPSSPKALGSLATVFGQEGDPDLTNNSAVATVRSEYTVYLPLVLR